nr:hypothetical protein [Pseudomonas sp. UBA6718]
MSSEVKLYDAYGNAMAPGDPDSLAIFVLASDYAALEAECGRLRELVGDYICKIDEEKKRLVSQANMTSAARRERDAARAKLAAIQGGMGEADKHEAQPEVAENTGSHAMATNQLPRQEQAVARDVEGVAAPCEASPGDDIFAWATFDGEGSYDLRLFDGNESYRDDFRRNNPKHHPDWVFPLYRNSITAAMAAEVETWRSNALMLEQANVGLAQLNGKLRAELAEVKGREAVGEVQLRTGGGISLLHVDLTQPLPPGTKLYTAPQPAPAQDVAGLASSDPVAKAEFETRLRKEFESRWPKPKGVTWGAGINDYCVSEFAEGIALSYPDMWMAYKAGAMRTNQ